MHHTIIAVDVEAFSQRDAAHQRRIRDELTPLVRKALEHCGLPWEKCDREDRGDGLLVLAPADARKERLAECLPNELAARLRDYNHGAATGARIRLRIVMHAGEVDEDQQGFSSRDVIFACRLLDSDAARRALARSHGVLAVITSAEFFRDVIESHPAANPDIYDNVRVTGGKIDTAAWICLPDNHARARQEMPPPTPDEGRRPPGGSPTRARRLPALSTLSAIVLLLLTGSQVSDLLAAAPPVHRCPEPVQLNLSVSADTETVIRKLARFFEERSRSGAHGCKEVNVQVTAKDPDRVIAALGRGWSGSMDLPDVGPQPHVWLPETRWEAEAAKAELERNPLTEVKLEIKGPIATSPLVLATPRTADGPASAPDQPRDWQELLEKAKFTPAGQNGAGFQRPSPVTSGTGLLATITLYSAALGKALDAKVLAASEARSQLNAIERSIDASNATSTTMLCSLRRQANEPQAVGPVMLVSEKAAGDYNEGRALGHDCPREGRPAIPLELSHPSNGTPHLDHPFVVVNWTSRPVNAQRQRVIRDFFDFLVGREAQDELRREGFRNLAGNVAPFEGALPGPPAELPIQDVDVPAVLRAYYDARKPARALFLVDVSDPMAARFPGAGGSRLQVATQAIKRSLPPATGKDRVALWAFAQKLDGQRDHRELAAMGEPAAVRDNLNRLRAGGRTAQLRIPLLAAVDSFRSTGDTRDAIVVIADGTAMDQSSERELVDTLRRIPRRVQVFMIAFGASVCSSALWQQINLITGGACHSAGSVADLENALGGVTAGLWGGGHG